MLNRRYLLSKLGVRVCNAVQLHGAVPEQFRGQAREETNL